MSASTLPAPDFFLAGAPKCGTTALFEYLRHHPAIFMCTPKEPGFFLLDMPAYRNIRTDEEYAALFRRCPSTTRITGDASPLYLSSETALREIRRRRPEARFVVMLRNPVDMALSMHAQTVFVQEEDETDFLRAWDLQEARREGRCIPPACREVRILLYRDLALYGRQLECLFSLFPRERVRVLLYEDFCVDTRAAYESVLAFLGVPSDGRTDFPSVNRRKEARFPRLMRLLQKPPPWVERLARAATLRFGDAFLSSVNRLRTWNSRPMQKTVLPPAERARVAAAFVEDRHRLEHLLGRDLSVWEAHNA